MNTTTLFNKLPEKFYTRDVLTVARELPGKILVRKKGRKLFSGKIVEVEAYDGKTDRAAHSYKGITPRTEVMFRKGGYLYVYFTYGNHFCCNVVAGEEGHGSAVLIRAVEPIDGINFMSLNRFGVKNPDEKQFLNLTSGPGKLCKAFEINRSDSGMDLTGNQIYLLNRRKLSDNQIVQTTRIGITKSVSLKWRFYIKNNPFVSRK